MEESPEEVLARLEQYVESARARRPVSAQVPAVDTLIPTRSEPRRVRGSLLSEVAPGLLAVMICTFVILVSEWVDVVAAVAVGAALMVVGLVGLAQRVPLAKAWTFGLVVAGLLIRFS